jgi:hypothetical protein
LRSDRAPDQATTATGDRIAPEMEPVAEPAAAKRKLAIILSADVKAFSRLMEADEEATLRTLKAYRIAIDALISRLQALADPGGVFISGGIYDQIKTKEAFEYEFLGAQKVKNIAEPVRVYRVHHDPAAALASRTARRRRRWALNAAVTVLIFAGALGIWHGIPLLAPAIERLTGASSAVLVIDPASIAVLPFANQSGREEDYFSEGLTEDLISALGRFSSLSVMSWNAVALRQATYPQLLHHHPGRDLSALTTRHPRDSANVVFT